MVVDAKAKQALWELIPEDRSVPPYILHKKAMPLVTIRNDLNPLLIASLLKRELPS